MKQETFRRELKNLTPDVPEVFHQRVEAFLQEKVDQEVNMKESTKRVLYTGGRFSSRALIFALVAVLMLGTMAFAATQWGIFDTLSWLGTQPPTADSVMQGKLHTETVNGVEITIEEAGYDGKTLFLQYSYRFPGITEQLGEVMGKKGVRMLTEDDLALFDQYGIGWWMDAFWVNGQCMDMAGGSGSTDTPGSNPGEIIHTEYWRLDNIDVELTGKIEISLPIGEQQSGEYRKTLYDKASGQYMLPDKGVVTFTIDTKDTLSRVVKTNPNIATVTPDVTVQVSEVAYSPLMTYITLKMDPNPESLAAYKVEHGEGWMDEDGNLLWEYSGMDVYGAWISSLQLVDGEGTVIFPDNGGCNICGADWAEFTYPYMDAENLPEQLWLATVDNGEADMEYAIRVK